MPEMALEPVFWTRKAKPVCWLLSVPLFLIYTARLPEGGGLVLVRVGVRVKVEVGPVDVRVGVLVAPPGPGRLSF